ncbi:MAG: hypothetical protein LBP53_08465 [Candidatus Peribacteria bacterium]|jgi:hypothetical protein|nr:hypothetical protein [Candidatus Peribacteria bacterium]
MSLRVSLSAHIPIIQVYNLEGTLMFTITLPTQQLVAVEAPAYTSTTIDDSSFGIFQGGKAIHRNGENMLFVAPTGQIYSDKNLYGTYAYHPDQQTISYLFKESALSPESDTITITIKIAPFKK